MEVASVRVPLGMSSPGQDDHRGWAAWSYFIHSPLYSERRDFTAIGKSELSEKGGTGTSCHRPNIFSHRSQQNSTDGAQRGRLGVRVELGWREGGGQ